MKRIGADWSGSWPGLRTGPGDRVRDSRMVQREGACCMFRSLLPGAKSAYCCLV